MMSYRKYLMAALATAALAACAGNPDPAPSPTASEGSPVTGIHVNGGIVNPQPPSCTYQGLPIDKQYGELTIHCPGDNISQGTFIYAYSFGNWVQLGSVPGPLVGQVDKTVRPMLPQDVTLLACSVYGTALPEQVLPGATGCDPTATTVSITVFESSSSGGSGSSGGHGGGGCPEGTWKCGKFCC